MEALDEAVGLRTPYFGAPMLHLVEGEVEFKGMRLSPQNSRPLSVRMAPTGMARSA